MIDSIFNCLTVTLPSGLVGAFADGASHKLTTVYATLVAAQVDFPFLNNAQYLANEFDWAVIQLGLNSHLVIYLSSRAGTGTTYITNDTLLFKSGQQIYGDGMGVSQISYYGASSVLQRGSKALRVQIRDLAVWNVQPGKLSMYSSPPVTGSVGIDLSDVSYCQIQRIMLRGHEAGIVGRDSGHGAGQYNEIISCDVAENVYGARLGTGTGPGQTAANAWHVYGGRFFDNKIGIQITASVGNHISSTFERSSEGGVIFAEGASECSVTASYFEGNRGGAVRFEAGATFNIESGNLYANAEDTVLDNDGSNVSFAPRVPSSPTMYTGIGAGLNLIPNGSFEVDSNSDGIADGWYVPDGTVPGASYGLDTTHANVKFGTKSQRFVYSAPLSQRNLQLDLSVAKGQWYVFTGWTLIDPNSAGRFSLRIGINGGDSSYYSSGSLVTTGTWQLHRIAFPTTTTALSTTTTLSIYVFEQDVTTPGGPFAIYLDGFKLEPGIVPTHWYERNLITSAGSLGSALSATGTDVTITPTHSIHHVTGSGTIKTIVAPAGFVGELTLIPDEPWKTTTSGNIANAVTATIHRPVRCTYDPVTAKWYLAA